MKNIFLTLTLAVFLCGCNQSPDPRIAQLEQRIFRLEAQQKDLTNIVTALGKYVDAQDEVNTAKKDLAKEQFKLWQLKHAK
ncbi:MAG: hypothetical protein NTZ16_12610 [Verrucomicrobia bacterium]|nr:hypothetical protein [Verrucomicrobiota bacterium]